MATDMAAAQEIAQRVIDGRQAQQVVPIALAYVREYPSSYVFTFNSKTFLHTGAMEHALAGGAGPIVIRKDDGSVAVTSGEVDIEEYLGETPLTDWIRVHER